ncbi:glycerophosphodiester phosphodiesterase, partial [Candidatus Bathyarchaeota archaeon]
MLKIGHRGARAYEPENTLASFRRAIELGVDAVELDIRKTRDNELVVIHNADVNKTTNGNGPVNSFTLEEIQKFVTEKGEHIPTLEDVLDVVGKRVKVLVELKEPDTEKKVIELIRRKKLMDDVILISFDEN